MYIGIAEESGKTVRKDDAFSYACERCKSGNLEEQETFLELARYCEDMDDFSENLIEWFFSGNWVKEEFHESV
ncbi:MAG: hypothetical protein MSA90_22205 [Faecalicatena sp.]|uniref:hypothetical protein n=1 Tax=Faecalicatena sp. TaxID=2005360 RepID=UPI00258C30BF|nr:hypothetical protein [Faecalicatena sp.]MCI6468164.1 hypothetical protein [Faecalicatena sp.]MDY5620419.1 hypothetical protein [Lachnospiraceae bacterium]